MKLFIKRVVTRDANDTNVYKERLIRGRGIDLLFFKVPQNPSSRLDQPVPANQERSVFVISLEAMQLLVERILTSRRNAILDFSHRIDQ